MKRKVNSKLGLALGGLWVISTLSGCAAPREPTVGERMLIQSNSASELGRQWEAGNEKVKKGEKLIKKGNALIKESRQDLRDGEDKVANGKALIEQGRKQMDDSERQYHLRFPASN